MERMTTLVYADDADAIAFVERRGLAIDGGGQLGKLDLTGPRRIEASDRSTVSRSRPWPSGRDLEPELYEIHKLTFPEIPFLAKEPMPSFETWQETGTADAGYLADLSLLAIEDGRLLGAVEVYDNGDDVIFIGMTAVHPEARRRGIARQLKVELERRARAAGIAPDRDLQRRHERAHPRAQRIARLRLQPALRGAPRSVAAAARIRAGAS